MGNFAQQRGGQQASMSPFLSALFNAYQPQMQGQMQGLQQGPNALGQMPGMDALSQMQFQQSQNKDFGGGAYDPKAAYEQQVAAMGWAPDQNQMNAYQNALGTIPQGTANANEVAANIALFGQGYGGIRDGNSQGGMQVYQLMQAMQNQNGGIMAPGGGYPVTPPMTVGAPGTPTTGYPTDQPQTMGGNDGMSQLLERLQKQGGGVGMPGIGQGAMPTQMPGGNDTMSQLLEQLQAQGGRMPGIGQGLNMPPTMPKPMNPLQAGVQQMNAAQTMNTMPNPTTRVLGGTAGMNPLVPKRNSWGVL